ncbi:hypothetical protein [Tenacibaculum halocynthiae]|uniref:hypothetical protein n=1 Tax=Tenacibaculum halocynthiae TaxID=1254437 RepID=UPI00389605F6
MYEEVNKPKENKTRAVANSVIQNKSIGEKMVALVDNRSGSVAQRQLLRRMNFEENTEKIGNKTQVGIKENTSLQLKQTKANKVPKNITSSNRQVYQLAKGITPVIKMNTRSMTKANQVIHKPKFKTYSHRKDPSLIPYLTNKETIIREDAVKKQRQKQQSLLKIRVAAKKMKNTTMGQGFHEILPTSEGTKVSKITDDKMRDVAAQIQSGMRTTPALTPLVNPKGGTSGHTGTYVDPKKTTASQYTNGQAGAHDELRKAFEEGLKTKDEDLLFQYMLQGNLDTTPPGIDMIRDTNLQGKIPNLQDVTNITEFARIHNKNREKAKDRARTIWEKLPAASRSKAREPSPEREPIDQFGKGGEYSKKKQKRSRSPEPTFPATDKYAHKAAWSTESMRLDTFK